MFIKFKQFIKEEWKFFVVLALFYLAMTYELPYVIYTPGGHINMSERVKGENVYESDGSLSMTYVSMVKGTIPFLTMAKFIPNWDIVSKDALSYDDADFEESVQIDKIYMKEAISNAEYVAYTKADIDFEEKEVHNIVTYKSGNAQTELKYGDEILAVDGKDYTNLQDFQEYVSSRRVGDEIKIEYMRDDKKKTDTVTLIDLNGEAKVGISIATVVDYDTKFDISVKTKTSESGPSGGLITALDIYNKIVEEDITKGNVIMGTGTIDRDGKVGEIGGVKYKLLGAYKDGAKIFICPKENYEEALKVKNEEDMDITLLGVGTFDEALMKLSELK